MGRRSTRSFRADAVDPLALERILTAATWAPSAHNRQPWRFTVVNGKPAKAALASAMGRRLREDRLKHGDDPDAVAADVTRSRARLTEAPTLILACLTMAEMDFYPDPARRQAEYIMAVQSTAMAVQNLLLAAHVEGLGSCVMCAPLFCPDTVLETLGLPRGWQPQSLITLGRPIGPVRQRGRKPLREVCVRVDEAKPHPVEFER
jgi:F420 biosynthesis protein FbiB-like protein